MPSLNSIGQNYPPVGLINYQRLQSENEYSAWDDVYSVSPQSSAEFTHRQKSFIPDTSNHLLRLLFLINENVLIPNIPRSTEDEEAIFYLQIVDSSGLIIRKLLSKEMVG